jgi:peptidylprolyl isomerase
MPIERVVMMDGDEDLVPEPGDTVVLHAIGYGKNKDFAQVFWRTDDADNKDSVGKPYSFVVGENQAIEGIDQAIQMMGLGEKARITISADLGYGDGGFRAWGIEPRQPLVFDIELMLIIGTRFGEAIREGLVEASTLGS